MNIDDGQVLGNDIRSAGDGDGVGVDHDNNVDDDDNDDYVNGDLRL